MRIENNFNSPMINPVVRNNNRFQQVYESKNNQSQEVINNEEKQFFANLFPEKQTEVMNYNFYNRSGKVNNVAQLGTIIDRRF